MVKSFDLFQVGGAVRDRALGLDSKDIDFVAVAPPGNYRDALVAFEMLEEELTEEGFNIYLSKPEYLTIRAKFPADHVHAGTDADIVLARKEGPYSDGRRPDYVWPGSLMDDLLRRDFTVNAMALDLDGTLIDPFSGRIDLMRKTLRCVGSAEERLTEDALRALRAIRFRITKGFQWDFELRNALTSLWLPPLLSSVSAERRREELDRCFKHDTLMTLEILSHEVTPEFIEAIFADGLRLMPTMKS